MAATVTYLGDEASVAGYRLAGAATIVAEPGNEAQDLARALGKASLVLVSAAVAARVPESTLRSAQAALQPLLLVVPDLAGNVGMPDIVHRLRSQLGLEA